MSSKLQSLTIKDDYPKTKLRNYYENLKSSKNKMNWPRRKLKPRMDLNNTSILLNTLLKTKNSKVKFKMMKRKKLLISVQDKMHG